MDFQKAFDRVWHTGLVHKLRTLGVLPNSVSWISSFLTNRTIAVRVGSCLSSQHTISAGVPQGSHLGPVLFLVFINDLPVNIPTELYADDALLHHTFKRSTTALSVRGELQTAVLAAEQWALQWHGRFGHTKTKQLNIGQRQNLSLATVIEDHLIEEVVRHKHLGITFTSDLKWNVHIQGVIGKACVLFFIRYSNLTTVLYVPLRVYRTGKHTGNCGLRILRRSRQARRRYGPVER